MREVILVAHNIRSTHNVGAFFRTCDGLGVKKIIFSGYTPYPKLEGDSRLPHFADKITRQIHKTALGAESEVSFTHRELGSVIAELKSENTVLVGLEQTDTSLSPEKCRKVLDTKYSSQPVALFIGNELHGIDEEVLGHMDLTMEIPMQGSKESLNVSVATGIALYVLTI
jgi:23S rRNA (guanosine2251-2'-O)-methyltransferase